MKKTYQTLLSVQKTPTAMNLNMDLSIYLAIESETPDGTKPTGNIKLCYTADDPYAQASRTTELEDNPHTLIPVTSSTTLTEMQYEHFEHAFLKQAITMEKEGLWDAYPLAHTWYKYKQPKLQAIISSIGKIIDISPDYAYTNKR